MTILIFNTFYYPKFIGGAEVSVQMLAEGLVSSGHKVFIVTSGKQKSVSRLNGVVILRITQKNIYSTYDNYDKPSILKVMWHLLDSANPFNYYPVTKILRRIRPDVVHSNNIQGLSLLLWLSVKRQKIPLIHTLRDYYMICHRSNLFNDHKNCDRLCFSCKITCTIKKKFTLLPDQYVGISNFIISKHSDYFNMKSYCVIPNAVKFPVQIEKSSQKKKITFGYIGRIEDDKGVGYLAQELLKIDKRLSDQFKVLLAGKGEENYILNLESLLKETDIEFIGVVNPVEFYGKIDVLIVPSLWYEPFGRVVIESLSYGVPVCMSDRGGLKELYNPDCTWLFSPEKNDLHLLIQNLIVDNDVLIKKMNLSKNYAQRFSTERHIKDYMDVYRNLAQNQDA